MIGSIRGKVLSIDGISVLIELNDGLGYEVEVPGNILTKLHVGEECFLFIHHVVREDAELLYGFDSKESRLLFREVIKVSGVGPKVAMAILSSFDLMTFVEVISQERINSLCATPGVGKKTAERIVIELKDRLAKLRLPERTAMVAAIEGKGSSGGDATVAALSEKTQTPAFICEDAVGALVGLGFKENLAMPVVKEVFKDGMTTEETIVAALAKLSPRR